MLYDALGLTAVAPVIVVALRLLSFLSNILWNSPEPHEVHVWPSLIGRGFFTAQIVVG